MKGMKYTYDNRYDYDIKDACAEYGFLAPHSFWSDTNDNILAVCNGLGAEDDWRSEFIPDTIWGLNISLASIPHDWCFAHGRTERQFHKANLYFLFNMNQIIRKHSANELMLMLRYLRSNKYYMATESREGRAAFFKGKRTNR